MLIWSVCLKKINTCYNNPEESSTTEINKPSGYSLFAHCLIIIEVKIV